MGSLSGGNPVRLHHLTPTATKINVSSLRIDSLVLSYVMQNQLKLTKLTTTTNPRNPIYSMSKQAGKVIKVIREYGGAEGKV